MNLFTSKRQHRNVHVCIVQQSLPKGQYESTSPRSRTRMHLHVMSTNEDFVRAFTEKTN